jgi:ornithine cyclodeaminase/alanine dehydrogenase-like protein (mu-crystallin family)
LLHRGNPLPDREPSPWIGAAALRRLLPPEVIVDAVESALRRAHAPAGASHALGCDVAGGSFHVKAAAMTAPRAVYIAKVNANFPGNPARGLPTIQGIAVLFDATDGRVLALLDSPELTALRTGAATAIAARYLARVGPVRCLLVGAGRQAFDQIASVAVVRAIARVTIHDLDAARARALADRIGEELGLAVDVAHAIAPAARESDVIITCTTARAPLLFRDVVAPGTFVAAVGADHSSKQEIDPILVAAARCFVDSPEQALASGELHHAVAAGTLAPGAIAGRLDELVTGAITGRQSADQITLFDSVGIALEDAAAALAAYERWESTGRDDAS